MELARVVDQTDRQPVLRALDVRHRADRAAVEAPGFLDLEIEPAHDDRVRIQGSGGDRSEHNAADRRRADADAADGESFDPSSSAHADAPDHQSGCVAADADPDAAYTDALEVG